MQAIGAGATLLPLSGQVLNAPAPTPPGPAGPTTSTPEDRARRLQWWHEARFGMFIHFGLYSTFGRHEWVMENEGIPVEEYEQAVKRFHPVPDAPRAWANKPCTTSKPPPTPKPAQPFSAKALPALPTHSTWQECCALISVPNSMPIREPFSTSRSIRNNIAGAFALSPAKNLPFGASKTVKTLT